MAASKKTLSSGVNLFYTGSKVRILLNPSPQSLPLSRSPPRSKNKNTECWVVPRARDLRMYPFELGEAQAVITITYHCYWEALTIFDLFFSSG